MKLAFSVETGPELLWISGGGVIYMLIILKSYIQMDIYRGKILLTHEFSVCILSPLPIQVTSKDASVSDIFVVLRCIRLRDSISFSFSVHIYRWIFIGVRS